ncbi:MAG TPA: response regulator FixJ [Bauldia sp.]|nr:response regulator FixJ [Bauldia sp.]
MPEPTVHIIDDDDAVRDSLSFLLSSMKIPAVAYPSGAAFLAALPKDAAGCVVTDIRMPEMTGLELLQRLNADGVKLPVIVITGHADVPLAVEAMKLGAADFLEKPFDEDTLLGAVRAALDRQKHDGEVESHHARARALIATLSAREKQVLDGLVAGHPNKTIAFDLGISPRTVEIYRANVMTKMQAGSLSELVRMALGAAE